MAEEEGKKDEEKLESTSEGETLGHVSLDQARVQALRHARGNTDLLWQRYHQRDFVWEVVSQEEREYYYDIRLSFKPASQFRGGSGIERFIVNKRGAVEARQALVEPTVQSEPAVLGQLPRRRPPVLLLTGLGVVMIAVVALGAVFPSGGFDGLH